MYDTIILSLTKGGFKMEYFTVAEVAERFKVTKQAIHKWIDNGKLKAYKIADTTIRIKKEDADKLEKEAK